MNAWKRKAVDFFNNAIVTLAAPLKKTSRKWFPSIMLGMFLAIGRRTVTTWLRASGEEKNFRQHYYQIARYGERSQPINDQLAKMTLEQLEGILQNSNKITVVIDDTPEKRYGKKIEGAGWHHNPTPSRTDAKICFGHCWVVMSLIVEHPLWGTISLPLNAFLYVRQKEIRKLQKKYKIKFKTKTKLAVDLVKWLLPQITAFGKPLELIVDGGYAKESVLLPLMEKGVTVVTRLRKDAKLFEVPPPRVKGQRGPNRKYGTRISLEELTWYWDGWETVECRQYGRHVEKTVCTFIATSQITRGKPFRVVLIWEENGKWVPLISTDVEMSVVEILETYATRFSIEEMFKDLKEEWGLGKQQVRNLNANIGTTMMIMWGYTLVELWAWEEKEDRLKDRSRSPWDDVLRRPSHADKRNALRRTMIEQEFIDAFGRKLEPSIINSLLKFLGSIAP